MGINFKHIAAGALAGAGASFVLDGVSPMNGAIIGAIAGAAGEPIAKMLDGIMPETAPAAAA
jgi:hypothetical protein